MMRQTDIVGNPAVVIFGCEDCPKNLSRKITWEEAQTFIIICAKPYVVKLVGQDIR